MKDRWIIASLGESDGQKRIPGHSSGEIRPASQAMTMQQSLFTNVPMHRREMELSSRQVASFTPEENTVHIWVASVEDLFGAQHPLSQRDYSSFRLWQHPLCIALADTLSPNELKRLERFKVADAALLFLVAHAMTRLVLDRILPGICTRRQNFLTNAFGKAFIADVHLFFNLSHSWPLAALAVTRKAECGVDVEMRNDRLAWQDLSHEVLSPLEIDDVFSDPDPGMAFLRLWTLKEAAAKAAGLGLYWDFKSFSVREKSGAVIDKSGNPTGLRVQSIPCARLNKSLHGFLSVGCFSGEEDMPSLLIHKFNPCEYGLQRYNQVNS